MTGLLATALVFGTIFVGCDIDTGGTKGGGGGISITSSYTELAEHIAELPANTAATPHTVRLEEKVNGSPSRVNGSPSKSNGSPSNINGRLPDIKKLFIILYRERS
jgi:hypothetical protein